MAGDHIAGDYIDLDERRSSSLVRAMRNMFVNLERPPSLQRLLPWHYLCPTDEKLRLSLV
jgi:hypothetical protein